MSTPSRGSVVAMHCHTIGNRRIAVSIYPDWFQDHGIGLHVAPLRQCKQRDIISVLARFVVVAIDFLNSNAMDSP